MIKSGMSKTDTTLLIGSGYCLRETRSPRTRSSREREACTNINGCLTTGDETAANNQNRSCNSAFRFRANEQTRKKGRVGHSAANSPKGEQLQQVQQSPPSITCLDLLISSTFHSFCQDDTINNRRNGDRNAQFTADYFTSCDLSPVSRLLQPLYNLSFLSCPHDGRHP